MTQKEARILFTRLKAVWISLVFTLGYQIYSSEGYVKDTDYADGDYDGPHKNGGAHYLGTGEDFNLLSKTGKLITAGGSKEWQEIGELWEKFHPLCRWGGRFKDDNHISIFFNGRA